MPSRRLVPDIYPVVTRRARALWHIALTRSVYDPRTTEYLDRRMSEGLTKKEAYRCLKRYIAREVYGLLPMDRLTT